MDVPVAGTPRITALTYNNYMSVLSKKLLKLIQIFFKLAKKNCLLLLSHMAWISSFDVKHYKLFTTGCIKIMYKMIGTGIGAAEVTLMIVMLASRLIDKKILLCLCLNF